MTSEGIFNLKNSTILQFGSPELEGTVFLKMLQLVHFGKHSSGASHRNTRGSCV